MSMNWLEGMRPQPASPMTMPVFAGQKLVVDGGSSGIGRQVAADIVAAGGSTVVLGRHDTFFITQTVARGMLARHRPDRGRDADL
jgi:NAD(P)-dependent dehydrogenase (short-subunit alcohol dehydrogenase family)